MGSGCRVELVGRLGCCTSVQYGTSVQYRDLVGDAVGAAACFDRCFQSDVNIEDVSEVSNLQGPCHRMIGTGNEGEVVRGEGFVVPALMDRHVRPTEGYSLVIRGGLLGAVQEGLVRSAGADARMRRGRALRWSLAAADVTGARLPLG